MVGVPTSNRCDTCKKRKKKCDEKRPQCTPCVRSGWECPGYKTYWKFVDEVPRLEEHYTNNKYVLDVVDSKLPETAIEKLRHERVVMWETPPVPRYINPNPAGSAFVFCLGSNVTDRLFPLRLVGSFFQFIPARLGRNSALDDAVECICSIYSRAPPAPNEVSRGTYRDYAKALASLRACLDDPIMRMESETLCASIILALCELVVNIDRGEWSHLLQGTISLLNSRGVQRYKNEFDHAMLESQLGFILGHSMQSREDCFVRFSEWRNLLWHNTSWPFQLDQSPSLRLRTRLMGILVDLPTLIRSATAKESMPQLGSEKKVDDLITSFYQMAVNIQSWLKVDAEPFLTLGTSNQGDHIEYPDLIAGVNDCVSHKALETIEKALRILSKIRSSSNQSRISSLHGEFEGTLLLGDARTMEIRRHRILSAFNFVKRECQFAAKPLEFGLMHIRSADSNDEP
ncbi:hypothetical protein BKA65DRAFT_34098 [Rhexocercosporidium sp. MPI-PUGE-AT-0058]|nr:hypothetical protein BKA65DRAFT_34098 [Rhexocercosporidium sp. MPI-PUGE-AT-0058]